MYVRNYPEDSVLRRHHEAATGIKRQAWLQRTPEDSVLRRHRAQLTGAGDRPAAATARSAPTRPEQARSEPSMPPQAETQATGFFAWLGRLFGGSR